MTKKEIRTQYSGFAVFGAKLLTVVTGMLFTLLVTRSVTQEEYGAFGTINIIVPYFTLLSTAISFWTMRFVARNEKGAVKTGIVANAGISLAAALVFLVLLPSILPTFQLQNYVIPCLAAAAQIVELYLITVLDACLQAQRPHYVGYGLLIGEILKLVLGYVFVLSLQLSLSGVLISIIIAFAVKIAFYLKTVLNELKQRVVFSYIKEWFKGSAFNIYNIAGDRLAAVIFLFLSGYGGKIATSYYQAAAPIANVITYSSFLAFALYPKLLAEKKLEEITSSLKLVLMFAIPMTATLIVIPDSYLLILEGSGETNYHIAAPLLAILAVDALVLTISTVFAYAVYGIEKIDEKATIPFKQVVRTRLFIAFSLPYAHSMITLPTAYYVMTNFTNNDPLLIATYLMAINAVAHLAMLIVIYFLVRKAAKIVIPWKNIAKYAFASISMTAILFAIHPVRTLLTLAATAVGGIIYLAIVLVIDKEARNLAREMFKEIKTRIKRRRT